MKNQHICLIGKNNNITANEAQSYFISVIYWETKVHLNHSNSIKKKDLLNDAVLD
jgi:hypothetical protein